MLPVPPTAARTEGSSALPTEYKSMTLTYKTSKSPIPLNSNRTNCLDTSSSVQPQTKQYSLKRKERVRTHELTSIFSHPCPAQSISNPPSVVGLQLHTQQSPPFLAVTPMTGTPRPRQLAVWLFTSSALLKQMLLEGTTGEGVAAAAWMTRPISDEARFWFAMGEVRV
jgi:hypothetical protein